MSDRAWWWLASVGRLAPGWSAERASAQLAAISKDLFQTTAPSGQPASETDAYLASTLGAFPAATGVSGTVREEYSAPLWVLLAIAGVVLVIAAANIATLLLARATARERDAALRLALGASRRRLVRQLFTESLLLSIVGAAAGIALAQVTSEAMVGLLRSTGFQFFAIAFDLRPNWRVILFAAGVAIAACLLFGVAPALIATRPRASALVRALTRTSSAARPRARLRSALVVVQVALALTLLVTALLFARTLRNLSSADTGFDARDITVFVVQHPHIAPDRRHQAQLELIAAIRALPGTAAAASAAMVPLSGESWTGHVLIDGVRLQRETQFNRAGPSFFQTMATPFVAGRDFNGDDAPASRRVAIVNELFARELLAGRNPIGATFQLPARPGKAPATFEIVGVVRNIKHLGLREPAAPTAFFPVSQESRPPEYVNLLVRTSGPAAIRSITDAIARLEPSSVILAMSMQSLLDDQVVRERLLAVLAGAFAAVAALLALVGLYGAVAYGVTQRTHEIGVRMALGARRSEVLALVVGQSAMLAAVGVALGAGAAAIATPAFAGLLFGLGPLDPASYVAVSAAFLAVAAAAAYMPARRATRVDPIVALRCD